MTDSTGVPPQPTVRRVCVVGSSFRFMSGISMYTCCLANAFADDYETSAVLMRRLIPRSLYPGRNRVGSKMTTMRYRDSVDVFDGIDYFWVPSIFRGIRFLMRNRPEVVVFQWWSGAVLHTYLLLAMVARLIGARIILEFHETLDTAEARIPLAGAYVRLLGKPFMGLVSAGVVHSAGDVSAIREKYPVFRDREVAVVPMGPYDHEVDPNRRQPPKPGTFRLLYFGTIRPYKGVECLIRAFDALPDDIAQRFTLTIVGETWEGWTLPLELINASPRRGQITFVNDYVTDEQAAQFFRSADGVVLPYLRSSGSGPLHMTMSHGLPVAVTAVGGLVEAVDEYTGARLVRPNDIADLAAAIAELPAMMGPHQDPHSWRRTTRMIARLFEPARPPLSLLGPDMAHP
jgi:glycosyltransferase involved in cell wall biosynthesis